MGGIFGRHNRFVAQYRREKSNQLLLLQRTSSERRVSSLAHSHSSNDRGSLVSGAGPWRIPAWPCALQNWSCAILVRLRSIHAVVRRRLTSISAPCPRQGGQHRCQSHAAPRRCCLVPKSLQPLPPPPAASRLAPGPATSRGRALAGKGTVPIPCGAPPLLIGTRQGQSAASSARLAGNYETAHLKRFRMPREIFSMHAVGALTMRPFKTLTGHPRASQAMRVIPSCPALVAGGLSEIGAEALADAGATAARRSAAGAGFPLSLHA